MIKISAADLEREFERHFETASREPLLVTDEAGDLVMLPIAEYRRLKLLNGEPLGSIETDEAGAG